MGRGPPRSFALQVTHSKHKHTLSHAALEFELFLEGLYVKHKRTTKPKTERGAAVTCPPSSSTSAGKPSHNDVTVESSCLPSKCTWGPVALPVEPTSPTCWPLLTLCKPRIKKGSKETDLQPATTALWCQDTLGFRARQHAVCRAFHAIQEWVSPPLAPPSHAEPPTPYTPNCKPGVGLSPVPLWP